jgi:hypothetical protein
MQYQDEQAYKTWVGLCRCHVYGVSCRYHAFYPWCVVQALCVMQVLCIMWVLYIVCRLLHALCAGNASVMHASLWHWSGIGYASVLVLVMCALWHWLCGCISCCIGYASGIVSTVVASVVDPLSWLQWSMWGDVSRWKGEGRLKDALSVPVYGLSALTAWHSNLHVG